MRLAIARRRLSSDKASLFYGVRCSSPPLLDRGARTVRDNGTGRDNGGIPATSRAWRLCPGAAGLYIVV
jgi:hypothetical protein